MVLNFLLMLFAAGQRSTVHWETLLLQQPFSVSWDIVVDASTLILSFLGVYFCSDFKLSFLLVEEESIHSFSV